MADAGWLDEFRRHVGCCLDEQTTVEVLDGWEQIPGASEEELSAWLMEVVQRIDSTLDEPTRLRILERCGHGCADMHNAVEAALARRRQFASLDEYIQAEEREHRPGYRCERDGQVLYVYYTPSDMGIRCYCSLWHGLPEDACVSLTWCNCGRSHQERIWSALLGRPAKVEALASAISGADECRFAVHLSGSGNSPGVAAEADVFAGMQR